MTELPKFWTPPRTEVLGEGSIPESWQIGIRKAKEKADRDAAFWQEHWKDFLELYPDKFVAADQSGVIAAEDDLVDLVQMLEAEGRDRSKVTLRFITANPRLLLH